MYYYILYILYYGMYYYTLEDHVIYQILLGQSSRHNTVNQKGCKEKDRSDHYLMWR